MMRRALVLFVLLSSPLFAQQEPGLARGFAPEKVFDLGDLDSINMFNGNLSLRIPLGPSYPVGGSLSYAFTLSYNSKVWDYETYAGYPRAIANRRSNAGMGWLVSLGRLIPASDSSNEENFWVYESPDGHDHLFYTKLHDTDPTTALISGVTAVAYTRDGTYLRLLEKTTNTVDIEFPDGTVKTFGTDGRLLTIRDRSGNFISVTYLSSTLGTPCPAGDEFAWQITNFPASRTNYLCFDADFTYFENIYDGQQLKHLVLAAPPDPITQAERPPSMYTFNYLTPDVPRGCYSQYPNDSPVVEDLPMLDGITLPDGSVFTFTYLPNTISCDQGTLKSITLPTGARIDYTYRDFLISTNQCSNLVGWWTHYVGVGTRGITGPRLTEGTWTYTSDLFKTGIAYTTCPTDQPIQTLRLAPYEELVVTGSDPSGNVTEHYYSVWPPSDGEPIYDAQGQPTMTYDSPGGFKPEEYGLPFTRRFASDGRFLSRRTYTPGGYAANPKKPLRSEYVTYDRDATNCIYFDPDCFNANQRVPNERTLYHDDADRVADTSFANFDGLGHYRQTSLAGSFPSGNADTFVGYNTRDAQVNPTTGIASGTYPGAFAPPTLNDSWVLHLAPTSSVTAAGSVAITHTCYDFSTGVLRAQRRLKSLTRAAQDLLAVFTSTAGNLDAETYYGGDISANAPTTGTLCGTAATPPGTYDYRLSHAYNTNGVRTATQYAGVPFLSLNRTIHNPTGLPLSSTDSAGNTTTYGYDPSWRIARITPAGLTPKTYTYVIALGGSSPIPARVEQRHGMVEIDFQYDGMGRLWRTKQRLPDDTWSVQQNTYNANGWQTTRSEAERLPGGDEYAFAPTHQTVYDLYDPFGRPGRIESPDAKQALITYAGVRTTTRTQTINIPPTSVATRETYDRQGRLVQLTENADTTPEDGITGELTTTYTYDVGGRLNTVAMPGSQTRTFTYDNRDLLISEQHPELGVSGNGTTIYIPATCTQQPCGYDARGHPHRSITGSVDLTTNYDPAERVTLIKETNTNRKLNEFLYDTCPNGPCAGKIAATGRYHYDADLGEPWGDPTLNNQLAVFESYQYHATTGLPGRRDTTVGTTSQFTGADFYFEQAYTTIGDIGSVTYPCRKISNNCNPGERQRTVSYQYTRGLLTQVPGWANITYQPNRVLDTITHTNGARESWLPDPDGMQRPCKILAYTASVTITDNPNAPCGKQINGTPLWDTGAYAYDARGNIIQIGGDTFRYDGLDRLESWQVARADGWTEGNLQTYDTYGNLLGYTGRFCRPNGQSGIKCSFTTSPPHQIVGTTNHFLGFTYDELGNVTNDGNRAFAYDALGMTRAVVDGRDFRYLYTADNERIAIVERTGGVNKTTFSLRGFANQLLSTWNTPTTLSWSEDAIWRGNRLLANASLANGDRHYAPDHLGSPRAITSPSGALLGIQAFAVFGGGGTSNGGALQFTGHERDAAFVGNGTTNLPDYFHARYYDQNLGRFLSVDPELDPEKIKYEPQQWNRYPYVMNNPLRYIDPDGKEAIPGELAAFDTSLGPNSVWGGVVRPFLHLDSLAEAFSGFGSAPWNEKLMASAIGVIAGADIASNALSPGKRVAVAGAEAIGFKSFRAFKRMLGTAGEGVHWHHIVEQTSANTARFGGEALQNTANVVRLDAATHAKISTYYSSKQSFTGGLTVREWLSKKSLKEQYEFGQRILEKMSKAQ